MPKAAYSPSKLTILHIGRFFKKGYQFLYRVQNEALASLGGKTADNMAMFVFKKPLPDLNTKKNELIFATYPISDTDNPGKVEAGTLPASALLLSCQNALHEADEKAHAYKFVIPVATTKTIKGIPHDHWLTLYLEFNADKKLEKVNCYDSYNLPIKYSLTELETIIKNIFLAPLPKIDLGQQSISNTKDCAPFFLQNSAALVDGAAPDKKLVITEQMHETDKNQHLQWLNARDVNELLAIIANPVNANAAIHENRLTMESNNNDDDEDGFVVVAAPADKMEKNGQERLIPTDSSHICSKKEKTITISSSYLLSKPPIIFKEQEEKKNLIDKRSKMANLLQNTLYVEKTHADLMLSQPHFIDQLEIYNRLSLLGTFKAPILSLFNNDIFAAEDQDKIKEELKDFANDLLLSMLNAKKSNLPQQKPFKFELLNYFQIKKDQSRQQITEKIESQLVAAINKVISKEHFDKSPAQASKDQLIRIMMNAMVEYKAAHLQHKSTPLNANFTILQNELVALTSIGMEKPKASKQSQL